MVIGKFRKKNPICFKFSNKPDLYGPRKHNYASSRRLEQSTDYWRSSMEFPLRIKLLDSDETF